METKFESLSNSNYISSKWSADSRKGPVFRINRTKDNAKEIFDLCPDQI